MSSRQFRTFPRYESIRPETSWLDIGSLGADSTIEERSVSRWVLSGTRRAIDLVVALVTLIVLAPAMAALAVAVRLDSPGDVLFRQERMGRNGHTFTLFKFRSMRAESDDESPITVTGDQRVTRVGKILRRYKLDEFPQFWNVLCGDMGLVGPRPKLPQHEALHMPFRPGITGAATLAFRFEEEMLSRVPREHLDAYYDQYVKPSKARIDWSYMCSATIGTDFGVLWQTAKACFSDSKPSYQVKLPDFPVVAHELILWESSASASPAL